MAEGLIIDEKSERRKVRLGPMGSTGSPPPWLKPQTFGPHLALRALRTYSHSVPCTDKSRLIPGLSLGYRPYSNFWAVLCTAASAVNSNMNGLVDWARTFAAATCLTVFKARLVPSLENKRGDLLFLIV